MRQNRLWLLLVATLCIILVACGRAEEERPTKTVSSKKSSSSSVVVTSKPSSVASSTKEEAPSSSSTTSSLAADASFNGSYYSVQGKYGRVIIVNKKHPLSADYAPGEDPTALAAFQQLIADMQSYGFDVGNSYSGFRSYETQSGIYNGYLATDSQANVDTYSARPGFSEHQTGLAFDVLTSSGGFLTEPTAANWLANHAHEYGFIVRYTAGNEAITGYMAESWHIRYIGNEASDIYVSGLTLEEYFGVEGGDYID